MRWTGYVSPLYAQTYTFYINVIQGRLWVNNILIIDNWNGVAGQSWKRGRPCCLIAVGRRDERDVCDPDGDDPVPDQGRVPEDDRERLGGPVVVVHVADEAGDSTGATLLVGDADLGRPVHHHARVVIHDRNEVNMQRAIRQRLLLRFIAECQRAPDALLRRGPAARADDLLRRYRDRVGRATGVSS